MLSNYNDIWENNSSTELIKIVRTSEYTEFAEQTNNILNSTIISYPCIVEFDYYQVDGSQSSFMCVTTQNNQMLTRRIEHVGGTSTINKFEAELYKITLT